MSTINIPRSVDEALSSLGGIGRLVTAKEWERAAIVYALTQPAPGRRSDLGTYVPRLSYVDLAEKGIVGLTNRHRVGWYHDQWQNVVDAGYAPAVGLGASIEIPDDWEWPPNDTVGERDMSMTPERREALMSAGREAGMKTGSKVVDVAANPRSLQAAIKADPATARAAAEALATTDPNALDDARMAARGLSGEPDPEISRAVRQVRSERDAWESSADRGDARGFEHEHKAMYELKWLVDNGHHERIPHIIAYAQGLLDLEKAQDLTPEMFHE